MKEGKWIELPNMNTPRGDYSGAVVSELHGLPRIFVFGGSNCGDILDTCEFLDVGEDKPQAEWTMVEAKMTTAPRHYATATLLNQTIVIICGGYYIASCELFDLITLTFSSFPDLIKTRYGHASIHYNDTVVVLGGVGKKTCELFDLVTNKWIAFPSLNEVHQCFGAAVIEEKIFVAGGEISDSVEVYDGCIWTVVTKLPAPRANFTAIDLDGTLVVLGGTQEEIDVFDPATGG